MFELAFHVTETSEDLKKVMEVMSTELRSPVVRKWIQQSLKSIPVLAINIGGFHLAERESVPVFLDFVANQIVDLLITF